VSESRAVRTIENLPRAKAVRVLRLSAASAVLLVLVTGSAATANSIDNFEEAPFDLIATGVISPPVVLSQTNLSSSNVLSTNRTITLALSGGGITVRASALLTTGPEDDAVEFALSLAAGPAVLEFRYDFSAGLDVTSLGTAFALDFTELNGFDGNGWCVEILSEAPPSAGTSFSCATSPEVGINLLPFASLLTSKASLPADPTAVTSIILRVDQNVIPQFFVLSGALSSFEIVPEPGVTLQSSVALLSLTLLLVLHRVRLP